MSLVPMLVAGMAAAAAVCVAQTLAEARVREQARARMLGLDPAEAARLLNPRRLADGLARRLDLALPGPLRRSLARDLEQAAQAGRSPGGVALRMLGAGLAFLIVSWYALGGLLPALAAAALGAALPWLALKEAAQDRLLRMRRALPDALDLLVSCVEAGLAFDLALARVAQRLPASPLKAELEAVVAHMRLGQARRDALKRLAARAGLDDLKSLVAALVQADQMGVPLSPTLRAQAAQLRALRSLRVQEQAARAPIKMLFPLMLFILPVVFLVLFGPIYLRWQSGGF